MNIRSLTLRQSLPNGEFHFDSEHATLERFDDGFIIVVEGVAHWQHASNVADCIVAYDSDTLHEHGSPGNYTVAATGGSAAFEETSSNG